VRFWLDNSRINNNLLEMAHEMQSWTGPVKVLSILSTVMFPKEVQYPVGPGDIFAGPPPAASECFVQ
jgi:hypothetical protein